MFRVAIEIGDRKSRSREVGNNRIENGTEGRSALPMAAEEMNTNSTDDWHDHQRDRLQLPKRISSLVTMTSCFGCLPSYTHFSIQCPPGSKRCGHDVNSAQPGARYTGYTLLGPQDSMRNRKVFGSYLRNWRQRLRRS